MQNTIIKEFENNPYVTVAMFEQGGLYGETPEWATTYWGAHYLRGTVIWDPTGHIAGGLFDQPNTGLPFGRQFVINPQGGVAHAYFGHDPHRSIELVYETYGGDGDVDDLHDAWETVHFGDLATTGDDDSDGDGSTNDEEYAAGTSPLDAADRLMLRLLKLDGQPAISFEAKPVEAWWHGDMQRLYTIRETDDVVAGSWGDVDALDELSGSGPLVVPLPPGGATRYYVLNARLE